MTVSVIFHGLSKDSYRMLPHLVECDGVQDSCISRPYRYRVPFFVRDWEVAHPFCSEDSNTLANLHHGSLVF